MKVELFCLDTACVMIFTSECSLGHGLHLTAVLRSTQPCFPAVGGPVLHASHAAWSACVCVCVSRWSCSAWTRRA